MNRRHPSDGGLVLEIGGLRCLRLFGRGLIIRRCRLRLCRLRRHGYGHGRLLLSGDCRCRSVVGSWRFCGFIKGSLRRSRGVVPCTVLDRGLDIRRRCGGFTGLNESVNGCWRCVRCRHRDGLGRRRLCHCRLGCHRFSRRRFLGNRLGEAGELRYGCRCCRRRLLCIGRRGGGGGERGYRLATLRAELCPLPHMRSTVRTEHDNSFRKWVVLFCIPC